MSRAQRSMERVARNEALQTRDRYGLGICKGPGSAVHHHSASKTRVNALMVLHRIRDTEGAE
jgi:hypothetical protein